MEDEKMTKKNAKTQWETEGRSFLDDLERGKRGEEAIIRHLKSFRNVVEVIDISKTKRGIADDVDLEVVYADGHHCTVEVKTDGKAYRTGNIAYEELSHKNPGCFARTKADHIFYLIEQTGEIFVLHPENFRAFIAEMKQDKEQAAKLKVRASFMGQGAFGYLVPIKSIAGTNVLEAKMQLGQAA